ncbi:hypothetical protein FRB94_010065 [Tulasnella sp. JGI-2019a]|nr:hypothetical protein FRB93_003930 [Tulasnella sp. JGI-2019a]KAG8994194.1 hypothetical protein FRB94_010065 [Tulasnella sp. JGI-2019a]KAG9033670.1 hypothetical protein FRB95_014558 [Tulasnella sp. JGI-2019a]
MSTSSRSASPSSDFDPQLSDHSQSSIHEVDTQKTEKDDSAMNSYTKKRRELLETLNSLHATGVQNELDLPQIVVVGSQSVGKSSLIESMSGIKLPRDTGTCTRCPTECRLQYGPTWTCTITLRFTVDAEDKPLQEVREVPFGPPLADKDEVEKVLRRAQRAILRSTLDPAMFLDDRDLSTSGDPALTFSQNCICIRVAGPQVPDLYFFDLPGIIANVGEGGNEQDIALVENLAKGFISRSNCIILLVISCETDFENQGAGRLVLRDSELKKRTVGVLTKVDRIESGSEQKWVDLIQGKENALVNGWYSVKQPDPTQLRDGISWGDAKAAEKTFFDRNSPWMQLPPRFRSRLGSPKLAEKLSVILSALVSQKLPEIQAEISKQLRFVDDELLELPAPNFTDPKAEVIRLLRDFDRKLALLIEGNSVNPANPSASGIMYSINQVFDRFKHAVFATTPHFLPWSSQREMTDELKKELMKIATQFDPEGSWSLDDPNIYHLEGVMDLAQKSRTRELPGNYPFLVKKQLIAETVVTWRTLASRCLDEVQELLDDHVKTVITDHFKNQILGGLRDAVVSVASEEIRKRFHKTLAEIDDLCQSENSPFTQNDHYFFDQKSKLLGVYKEVYRRSRNEEGVISSLRGFVTDMRPSEEAAQQTFDHINNALANLTALGLHGLTAVDLTKLLPEDENTPALEIMAEVRAYFQVAYKRFSDNIPKQIDTDFVRGTDRDVDYALMSMDLSHEQCAEWLQEDPEVVQRREDLVGKKKRLEAAKDKLGSVVRTSRVALA